MTNEFGAIKRAKLKKNIEVLFEKNDSWNEGDFERVFMKSVPTGFTKYESSWLMNWALKIIIFIKRLTETSLSLINWISHLKPMYAI